jgi:hypothetical protein
MLTKFSFPPFQWIDKELQRLEKYIERANEKGWRPEYPFSRLRSFSHLMILAAKNSCFPSFALAKCIYLWTASGLGTVNILDRILRCMNALKRDDYCAHHPKDNVFLKRPLELFQI